MARLIWDKTGERRYERGVSQCVLYPQTGGAYPEGVAWNGITNITQSPSGAEPTPQYADDIKYLNIMTVEEFGATIEAFYYPDAFAECNGQVEAAKGFKVHQQTRKPFGLCYKTKIGNDTDGLDHGYKLHFVYGALAAPSESNYESVNDSAEAPTMSWEVSTTPVSVTGLKPTAHCEIDSTTCDAEKLKELEDILYGKDGSEGQDAKPRLPLPDEIIELIGTVG